MDTDFIDTLILTGKLASITTVCLLLIGVWIAYALAYSNSRFKVVFEALICMPMVLPPTVIGYYLLVAFGPKNIFGKFLENSFGIRLAFSFEGVLIASIIAGLPFMIQPLQNGFSALPVSYREAAYTLGKSKITTFFKVLLPNIKPSIITGIALTFTHCIGEFGIVLMIGGNVSNETRIASIAIYDEVQTLNYTTANLYSLILSSVSFFFLILIYSINKKFTISSGI
ncbi:molybdate ABC transporter permease subunit [Candidatus Azobacteroides pseudotrichonymphae]|uniref:Molybdenum transport system permease n=1 Tax=Azobacteroides pseudotrichonymphae genomovar. CFP2 TaxID=511995 RepID=B6YR75_AZOPC|nr:molybdate ABC transporter permease subunit [Candidatus Azobacteroides pseudotrichonymphae]BAG83697.1 ABC-type molybdate transporter permease component [Candidatus Azobacteroides pseudotrichonymphae genomovar. CFP2]